MQVVYVLLHNPASTGQLWVMAFVASAAFAIAFTKVSKFLSYPLSAMPLSLCVTALVILVSLSLGAAAVTHLGAAKVMSQYHLVEWLPLAATFLGFVAIVAPAMRLITRSSYGPSLAGLLLASLAVVAVVIIVDTAFAALRSGDVDVERTRDRTQSVNRFLDN